MKSIELLVKGEITTFDEFIKYAFKEYLQCGNRYIERLQDNIEDTKKEYIHEFISDYYPNTVYHAQNKLEYLTSISDEILTTSEKDKLLNDYNIYNLKLTELHNRICIKNNMYDKVANWIPPFNSVNYWYYKDFKDYLLFALNTEESEGIDLQGLEYKLAEIKFNLDNFDINIIKQNLIDIATEELKEAIKNQKKDIARQEEETTQLSEILSSLTDTYI